MSSKAKLAEANKIPGFALGATTAEGEIYFGTGGYKTLDDPASGKVDPDTVFWICSMTKLVAHVRLSISCSDPQLLIDLRCRSPPSS
jgi:CubicO group peptidase (beta-lactamase class C family)